MNEILERVAKAVHAASDGFFHEDAAKCDLSRQIARAAIEAMDEPTEGMLSAGDRAIASCDTGWEANAGWRAMVAAALPKD